ERDGVRADPPPDEKRGERREDTREECTRVLVQHGLPDGRCGRAAPAGHRLAHRSHAHARAAGHPPGPPAGARESGARIRPRRHPGAVPRPPYGRTVTGVESSDYRGRRRSRTARGFRRSAPTATSPCTGGRIMGDKAHTHPGAAGRAQAADHPTSVRNVVLVGHSGSGKTTLVEALALTAGAINRAGRVEDGGTVSDYDEIEHRQQRSVQLSLVPVPWDGIKINLLDTPGYADFVGELRAGLRAADAALFVVSASDGVDGSTRMVWDECAAVG